MENPPMPEIPVEKQCTSNMKKEACEAHGGNYIEPLVEAPYCSCP
jgi:hypothetical protein